MCGKAVPPAFEVTPQFRVIVYLSVEHDPDSAVLICDGLMAPSQIDNAQSPKSETYTFAEVITFVVRAAMNDSPIHPLDDFLRELLQTVEFKNSANSAHGLCPHSKLRGRYPR